MLVDNRHLQPHQHLQSQLSIMLGLRASVRSSCLLCFGWLQTDVLMQGHWCKAVTSEHVLLCVMLPYLDVAQPLCPVSKDRRVLLTLLPHTLGIGGFVATAYEHDLPICHRPSEQAKEGVTA